MTFKTEHLEEGFTLEQIRRARAADPGPGAQHAAAQAASGLIGATPANILTAFELEYGLTADQMRTYPTPRQAARSTAAWLIYRHNPHLTWVAVGKFLLLANAYRSSNHVDPSMAAAVMRHIDTRIAA